MDKKNAKYIPFEEFVEKVSVKESTIRRRYKEIPGITKTENEFAVLSGTRYPCDLHRYKLSTSAKKRYILLKTISQYQYISHKDLKLEQPQFEEMLKELIEAGLIQNNHLSNEYGANAYDCSIRGDKLLKEDEKQAEAKILNMIAETAGTFVGAVISKIYNAA